MEKRKVAAIVQARMGSTRLPQKVMLPILDNPLLFYVVSRLKEAKTLSQIIIATTENPKDKAIVDFCKAEKIPYFIGSEENVLDRYLKAARAFGVDVIVRITSDCPLIDPEVVDKIVSLFLNVNPTFDFISNTLTRSFPRGLDVEVFSFEALEKSSLGASIEEKEHVTLGMLRNPSEFSIKNVINPVDYSYLRLTVDTKEDLRLVTKIIEALYPVKPHFRLEDIIYLLAANPDWLLINQHIRQKELG